MDINKLKQNWIKFIHEGIIDDSVKRVVSKSWKKCRDYGVDPYAGMGKIADENVFKSILTENEYLISIAKPIMQSVHEIVKRSHFLLVLTDSAGYILDTLGDDEVKKMSKGLKFQLGALWSDQEVGSNAIGVALDYDTAVQMVGPEHYCESHHNWTCSAAPIHGINGEVIGCIDMSGHYSKAHDHTLGLIVAAAFSIETQIASLHSAKLLRTALDASPNSVILLNENLKTIWLNKKAENTFGLNTAQLEGLDFCNLMPDVDWIQIQRSNKGGSYYTDDTKLQINGNIFYCSASISHTLDSGNKAFTVILKNQEHLIQSVNKVTGNCGKYTFDSIYTQDPGMKRVICLAQKFSRYDGYVLIEGESGTGKELFAQAIHNGSSRSDGPFVAVSCPSLPRDYIESELFGYEKGALTGALKEGNPGKFELANDGTLFLDEIGEMPLEFQAKLLRAVETLQIQRLGGKQDKKLNVRIIAATNRNLRLEAEYGHFRKDLYYRLNVLKIDIPPLRSRTKDICYCAQKFLNRLNEKYPEMSKEMHPEFLEELEKYSWPGNVRELQSFIERVFYVSNNKILTEEDFYTMMFQNDITYTNNILDIEENDEREAILEALINSRGSVEKAAMELGYSRASCYRKVKKLGIRPKSIKLLK